LRGNLTKITGKNNWKKEIPGKQSVLICDFQTEKLI